MALLRIVEAQVSSFSLPDLLLILGGGAVAFLLSYLFTFGVIKFCTRFDLLDRPTKDRDRIHKKPVPRLGGVAIFLAFVVASLIFYATNHEVKPDEMIRFILLMAASLLLVAVHAYDDVRGMRALHKFIVQSLAVVIILGPWNWHFYGIILFGFSNPFGVAVEHPGLPWYQQPIISILIHKPEITWLAIPAVIVTWFWFTGMTNTVNFVDGLDGLATGVVGITGFFITIISIYLGQYTIGLLAGIFTGAVLGFLPHNWSPAKIFMGDSGAQFLGFMLAALSIMGGAKLALALMVLGVPILDVAVIIVSRLRRGQSFAQPDTTSHLHYRLMATGLNAKQICYIFYGLTTAFGILALSLPKGVKIVGLLLVGATMLFLTFWLDNLQKQREALLNSPRPPLSDEQESNPTGDERHHARLQTES
ncbi:glycosyltransferase family 4 protein [Ktedonobacter racemifer]|uniref:Glycosyl transferase, family 4, conserved region n=1 Tax=Ktedonobacter racemifer DSM 44963 TaxID=485913 RepID=D6TDN5_KTERA|nr:MraY family glycosyltransferase [Ktedonobacter racemifer]EFH90167.1 Glycosyl transferase, family 4, conserved region [Ktedonobacter racemifer DSM 44963]